mmetsp:Transcript_60067/g.82263  ORF Transcript_60067/g.82263 Transcript_60067/m.82263 type:complete len:84 (-) Transcript_60067:496-747(-)
MSHQPPQAPPGSWLFRDYYSAEDSDAGVILVRYGYLSTYFSASIRSNDTIVLRGKHTYFCFTEKICIDVIYHSPAPPLHYYCG